MRKRFTLRQILILSFSLVCVLPVATLAIWLHYGIQQHALDEAREKNQILSQNLAIPIQTYLQDARLSLANLGGFLEQPENPKATSNAAKQQHYFRSILLLNEHGITRRLTTSTHTQTTLGDARLSALALPYLGSRSRTQTQVIRDPYSGEPTVLFVQPLGKDLLVGLLDLQPVVSLGQQVKFGERGHAAITDQLGNIVLHPNPHWIKEIKNIAELPIIQAALQGETGVMRFYSPFIKQDMIAGYASVPEFNWVIITPQPLAEFQARAYAMLRTVAWVATAAVLLALLLAVIISCWIAHPIAALATAMQRLPNNGYQDDFEVMSPVAPREFDSLQQRCKQMALEVRSAIGQRDDMNIELAQMVDRATRGLQDANSQLTQQALIDDLTQLSNRRALWQRISDLEQAQADSYLPVQVLLFDLDNFKDVNDTLGHAAGDQVLMHVASILERETREGDFVVRYGGDEFLVIMHRCTPGTAHERANLIRRAVRSQPLIIEGKTIIIDMSVGIAESESKLSRPSFNELLIAADQAMYVSKAKNKQRNPLYCI